MDVVQEMVREALEVAAPQSIGIEMEELRVGAGFLNSNLELCEKIVGQLF